MLKTLKNVEKYKKRLWTFDKNLAKICHQFNCYLCDVSTLQQV